MSTPKKIKSSKISDPAAYFAGWCFAVEAHHYAALGVTWRKFMLKKESLYSFAVDNPPRPCFEVGDVFYPQDPGDTRFLQVAVAGGDGMVEVHCGRVGSNLPRDGYLFWERDLAQWLQTGTMPPEFKLVMPGTSQAGLLGWSLAHPNS